MQLNWSTNKSHSNGNLARNVSTSRPLASSSGGTWRKKKTTDKKIEEAVSVALRPYEDTMRFADNAKGTQEEAVFTDAEELLFTSHATVRWKEIQNVVVLRTAENLKSARKALQEFELC